jgi:hypothetical protein
MPDQMCRGGKFIFSRIKEVTAEGWRCHAKRWLVYFQQNKKRRKPKVKLSRYNSPHVPLRQIAEGKRRGKELRVV